MVDSMGPHRNGKPQEGFGQNIFTSRTSGHTCSGRRVETSLADQYHGGREVSDDGDGGREGQLHRFQAIWQGAHVGGLVKGEQGKPRERQHPG